ncbi:MAG: glycosyltransferase [Chloroflexi bacterium]|nr:glycosyltransferase [Chloroflexota bacterium]
MRILFLSRWFPYPANNGSKLRIYNLLHGLGCVHAVDLVSFYDPAEGPADLDGLRGICQSVKAVAWREFDPASLSALRGLFGSTPRSVVDTYSPEMSRVVKDALDARPYDLLIASQIDMAPYAVEQAEIPILLEEAEVGVYAQKATRPSSWMGRLRHGLTWWKYRQYLHGLFRNITASTVVSEQEKKLLQSAVSEAHKVTVIPNCMQLQDYAGVTAVPDPGSLIYTGSFRYDVNYEAMLWFVREVFPLILLDHPQAALTITGDPAGKPLPVAKNVTQTGVVADVRPLVAAARVALAPLQTGGGTRLKILEAMALRTPVVSTSKGAEGLDAQPGEHLLVADSPQDFAEAVLRLLQDDDLHRRIAEGGFALVSQKFNWDAVLPGFLRLVEDAAHAGNNPDSGR